MSTQTQNTTTTWTLDRDHTQVEFRTKHMMITTVRGRFSEVEGAIELNEAEPGASRVTVRIGAASIDTRSKDRDAHLRSPDFLDVEAHPELTFRTRRVEGFSWEPGSSFRVAGDLTIRGVTREVVLDAVFGGTNTDPWGGERMAFSAETSIDRRDYGLEWNQALETGGVLVSNEVRIQIEAQAVREDAR